MEIAAPAKINLTLEVLNKRADGYHALRSVMVPLALHDTLQIESGDRFSLECSDASIAGPENIVARAAAALGDPALAVTLTKRIPMQAGLGGGSSDAAAFLRYVMTHAKSRERDWLGIARAIGSDVPFFLVESAALVEGTGERVTALGRVPAWHVLLVKPHDGVSTATAYEQLDLTERPTRARNASTSLRMVDALQRGCFDDVMKTIGNDFTDVVAERVETVALARSALERAGARKVTLCGSGSTLFAITRTADECAHIDDALELDARFTRIRTHFAQSDAWVGAS